MAILGGTKNLARKRRRRMKEKVELKSYLY
jgi:hypothetical protein